MDNKMNNMIKEFLENTDAENEEELNESLEFEKKRLEQEGYFDKENTGSFYGLFETRPYIRPVINITLENATILGDGTTSNPYVISYN